MNFETTTYDMKIFALPTADEMLNPSRSAASDMATGGGAVSGFLVWLRLWLTCLAPEGLRGGLQERLADIFSQGGSRASQDPRPPSLLPEAARAAYAPRLRANRQARRIMARGIPASRSYAALHHLNARILTVGQFKERACKLSASNRVVIYRLGGRKRLCQRREEVIKTGTTPSQSPYKGGHNQDLNLGLCDAHIWPS